MEKCKDLWFKISEKIRFLLIGSFNALVSYLMYSAFVFVLGEQHYQLSLALAWIFSSVISFFTQRLLVFRADGSLIKQYLKCCFTWFFSYLINAITLELFVKLDINVYLAQIFATVCSAVFTYVIFKLIVFKVKRVE